MKALLDLFEDFRALGFKFLLARVRAKLGHAAFRVRLPNGVSILVRAGDSDIHTLRQTFGKVEYRIESLAARKVLDGHYDAIVASGKVPVVVDAGANIGAASIWLKKRFPAATVVAVEPDPQNYAMLRANVESEPAIIPCQAAIGSENGFVSTINPGQSWGIQTERASEGCPVVTIADAVALVDNGELFLAKIDIEGFESDLFASNLGWLDTARAVYVEPHDWMMPGKGTSHNFQKAFGERNFEFFINGENLLYVRF